MSRTRSSLALLVGCVWALGLAGTAALAADMGLPVKAPPPPPPPPSWWSGFVEVVYEAGQVNPQGQAVYKNGDINVIAGVNLTLYKDKTGFINNATIGSLFIFDFVQGTWGPSDSIWAQFGGAGTAQGDANFYHIIAPNASVTFGQYWTLSDTFFFFDGTNAYGLTASAPPIPNPAGGCVTKTGIATGAPLGCLNLPAWYWNELKLSLNDGAITHWPISFNPYVIWYYEIYPSGETGVLTNTTSAACFSCNNQGTDFIIGMVPKLALQPYIGVPITLTAPTWVTVGPSSFWAGDNGGGPGSACIGGCKSPSNLGVFSTGLTASLAMTWVPAQYGHWNVKAGIQYYDILNNNLIADNQVTYGTSFTSHDIITGFVGLGVGF